MTANAAANATTVKGSDYIAQFLERQGVKVVFELSGGMITHMLDSIHRRGAIRLVSVHHEQAAAFAADAVGRLTHIPGVAMATSGPGATNLLTGIGSCYFDSSPAVFITGQVNRHEQKGDRSIRQLGFQETDIVSMARPVTKAVWLVKTSEELPRVLQAAFRLAVSGRPGPVLVDIPMDLQRIVADFGEDDETQCNPEPPPPIPSRLLGELLSALQKAERPLILAGGGVSAGQGQALLQRFAEAVRVPVVNSLMAVDVLPYSHPLRVGMIGSYGNRWANLALGSCDLLVVLGSRLDVRQTGSETAAFRQGRRIFHVDCEPAEINNRVIGCEAITCELRPFLEAACEGAEAVSGWNGWPAWTAEIHALRNRWPDTAELAGIPGINPNAFMHELSQSFTDASAWVVDVGQHQMWAAQSLELGPDQRFLTSGGMGSMGFSLPAAVGAAVVDSSKPVMVVAGDGAFQCNIQELQTVVRNSLPVKMIVIDNGCHGMVRQFQESYFESRYQSTLWGYSAPDFANVAAAYGLDARTVSEPSDVKSALQWLRSTELRPALLHVKINTFANAWPKIAFGRPVTDMEPMVSPLEQEGT